MNDIVIINIDYNDLEFATDLICKHYSIDYETPFDMKDFLESKQYGEYFISNVNNTMSFCHLKYLNGYVEWLKENNYMFKYNGCKLKLL